MQQEILKSINELSNNALEAARALGEINSKLVENTIKQQLKAADLFVDGSMRQAKLAQEVKEVKDFVAGQTALIEEYAGRYAELAKDNVALAQEAGVEYKAWIEKGIKKADTVVKSAAKKAA